MGKIEVEMEIHELMELMVNDMLIEMTDCFMTSNIAVAPTEALVSKFLGNIFAEGGKETLLKKEKETVINPNPLVDTFMKKLAEREDKKNNSLNDFGFEGIEKILKHYDIERDKDENEDDGDEKE